MTTATCFVRCLSQCLPAPSCGRSSSGWWPAVADDIRFHERLLRLSDWIDGDPNIDEDLWPIPNQALAEIRRLREELRAERNTLSAIYALAASVSIGNTADERAWIDIKHMTFDAWDQRRKEARRG